MKLNKKDYQILYHLDLNSRQTLSQLSKKVKLPKNVISYRIKRLEKEVIKSYYTVIDASKFGYFSVRLFLTFQFTNSEKENEIIKYFKDNPNTWWVSSTSPLFDLAIIIWVKDMQQFYNYWEATLIKYGKYFEKQINTIYTQAIHFHQEYLIDKQKENQPETIGGNKQIDIDQLSISILSILSKNARMNITEIASKLKTTPKKVLYRLKKLQKDKVILAFRININYEKINLQAYRLNLFIKDWSKKQAIEEYLTKNPNLLYINRVIGPQHLEFEFILPSFSEFESIIADLKLKFPNTIKNHNYFIFNKIHKEEFMPSVY